ncbi:phycobiliprotein lyase [Synechocystis sp. LKSZ1]|uniref:phycobiliprotein lyase n=1 Tax=Synechocystis sp. LKSZ1 TaxID=3144951 RepID=UPI00336C2C7A
MWSFPEFFEHCDGYWSIERTYHTPSTGEVERSHTDYHVTPLTDGEKLPLLAVAGGQVVFDQALLRQNPALIPGFQITFETLSEKGERRAMGLKALFVSDTYLQKDDSSPLALPLAAAVGHDPEIIQGYYLRDHGYEEAGAIAGRFTYQPQRHCLEMTTYYQQSVAVDQMHFLDAATRLRTITTYRRPLLNEIPTEITLVGFGLEKRYKFAEAPQA